MAQPKLASRGRKSQLRRQASALERAEQRVRDYERAVMLLPKIKDEAQREDQRKALDGRIKRAQQEMTSLLGRP